MPVFRLIASKLIRRRDVADRLTFKQRLLKPIAAVREAAKKHFDQLDKMKLPSINQLKQEWAALNAENRSVGANFMGRRAEMIEYLTARENAERILLGKRTPPRMDQNRDAR